jgi:hypothetical protein
MTTKQIWDEAFKAGFNAGYANGRASELTPSQTKTNAEAAYQHWLKENESALHVIDAGTFPKS